MVTSPYSFSVLAASSRIGTASGRMLYLSKSKFTPRNTLFFLTGGGAAATTGAGGGGAGGGGRKRCRTSRPVKRNSVSLLSTSQRRMSASLYLMKAPNPVPRHHSVLSCQNS